MFKGLGERSERLGGRRAVGSEMVGDDSEMVGAVGRRGEELG